MYIRAVIAQLIFYIKNEEEAEGNTNGKPKNIEQAVSFVSFKITDGNKQQVFYHDF
jgi:hypothetical protein